MPGDQSTALEPLSSCRSPMDDRPSEPPESTGAPSPVDQTEMPPA